MSTNQPETPPLDLMKEIVSLAKQRGFVFQSSEIYGGLKSAYDYGPLGVELKRNIMNEWWRAMVYEREDVVGLDASIIMHPKVWEASGHLAGFSDPLVDCRNCKERFRGDKAPRSAPGTAVTFIEGGRKGGKTLTGVVDDRGYVCPNCGSSDLSPERNFNLMFRTNLGPVDVVQDVVDAIHGKALSREDLRRVIEEKVRETAVYLRPETAQAMFVQFLNVQQSSSMKIPFGIAQMGKSFRNEVTVEHFIFRSCEFEQMEMEYFVEPGTQGKWLDYWKDERLKWYLRYATRPEKFRLRRHEDTERAHYADDCYDVEYLYPWGWGELEGIASRTDYDLKKHSEHAGVPLTYLDANRPDPKTGKPPLRFTPYVVEPAAGATRALLMFLLDAFRVEQKPRLSAKGEVETRRVLKLHPRLAPYKAAVLPLVKKDGMPELGRQIIQEFFAAGINARYDEQHAIGKRYARHDEIGTPYCITVDGDSVKQGLVTIRDRDTTEQVQVKIDEALSAVKERVFGDSLTVENAAIARVLSQMADILEIQDENVFKIRALRNAAQTIEVLPLELASLAGDPAKIREIKGIGEKIAQKIVELITTGACVEHQELLLKFPPGLLELLDLQGVGPKKVRQFHDVLGVKSLADLEAAARAGRVRGLPRMSAAAEEKVLKAIEGHRSRTGRFLLAWAEQSLARIQGLIQSVPGVRRLEPAGSFRRRRETIGDLDILVACQDPARVMEVFSKAGEVLVKGDTKCSVKLVSGLQVDLRVVPDESFGAALHYFTGSKAHNVEVRTLGVKRGLTINEYGVYEALADGSPGKRLGGEREEDVFAAVGLPWIPPELREQGGEIEAAAAGRLPRLLEVADMKGDVHSHTDATDGTASIEAMARAAAERGRRYLAITDHSKALAMARGLDDARARAHAARVATIGQALRGQIRLFSGIEVDILKDGALDLADETLRGLDVVVASVHSHFNLTREEMTARVVRAIDSGLVDIIGHPTGRLLLKRDPFPLDMERVLAAAKARGVAMELSANPDRLDLSDVHARMARDLGVKLVINTDAHAPSHFDFLRFGVGTARRGWLTAADVLNTREPDDFLARLHEGHR